jgi:uncharacterized protein (TIGR02001 family)
MNKVMLSVVAALAVSTAAPAFAADMPVKGKYMAPAPAPSPWDIAFGTAFTTDYVLRGISQSNSKPAVQGYFEGRYTINDMITLYAGLWGSSLSANTANAEFDASGGARFTFGKFGLDLGYVYYYYPNPVVGTSISYGEFYAKPSVALTDWLTIGGVVIGGDDFGNTGNNAWYYAGNATVTLPPFLPAGIVTSISGELGRQTFATAVGVPDYTTWNIGVAFNYKAITLDLRYHDSDLAPASCTVAGSVLCDERFVATLKFDTTLSALK